MKETTKIWVPDGIKTKDIHRIIERNGYANDTLGQELYAPNVVPYVITVSVKKIKGRKRSKKGQLEIELSDTKSLVFAGNQLAVAGPPTPAVGPMPVIYACKKGRNIVN